MVNLIFAIPILILAFVFADERAANVAAHEICPDTHVIRAAGGFEFSCEQEQFRVECEGGSCSVSRDAR